MINTLDIGGSEAQFTQVCVRLVARGHEVTVGVLKKQGVFLKQVEAGGIHVVEFSPGGSLVAPSGIKAVLGLARFLRQGKFDVVHTHDLYSNLLGTPAAWLAHIPRIVSSRRDLGSWWWYTRRNRKILRLIQQLSDIVVVNSCMVRDHLVTNDGFDPKQIRILYNGVAVERFSVVHRRDEFFAGLESKLLIAVSANMHVPTKGHEHLILAAQEICTRFPDCVFLLIGDGELRSLFEQKVNSLGLKTNFLFLGARNDVPDVLSCCDAGLLASLAEGLPNAVLEYMAAGLPVIATCVGGIPEIFGDSGAGLLVPPADPAALADAVCTVLADRGKSRAMGQKGRKRVVEQFSFGRLLTALESLYTDHTTSVESQSDPGTTRPCSGANATTQEVHNGVHA